MELHGCCARVSLAAALLSQHIDGVTRAGSPGTESRSSARSLVLLGLDDEVNSEIADGSATGSRLRGGTSVGDLPTSSISAAQLIPEKACLEQTHPVHSVWYLASVAWYIYRISAGRSNAETRELRERRNII